LGKVARLPQSALTVLTSTRLGSPHCHYALGYLCCLTGFPRSLGDTERSTGHGHMYCRPSLAYRCSTGARLVPRHLQEMRRREGFPRTGTPVQIHYDQEANPPTNHVPDTTGWLTAHTGQSGAICSIMVQTVISSCAPGVHRDGCSWLAGCDSTECQAIQAGCWGNSDGHSGDRGGSRLVAVRCL
jgi:hypothetical protein